MILSTHERASQARRAPAGSGVLQLRRLMPAAELESRLRCVRRRKMGAPKTENAVLCASSLHTSAGAMDPKRWRPSSRKISIAERVARGSAHGGAWCGSADGYFTRYFAPRGPIDESRPDRGYAAIDRARALGARVGRRVGEQATWAVRRPSDSAVCPCLERGGGTDECTLSGRAQPNRRYGRLRGSWRRVEAYRREGFCGATHERAELTALLSGGGHAARKL